ncbi:TPA: class I SAM-dependent methyltransferase [Candidatus Woesearchaeota archaeon]|nr:Methyltransferase type 11 [archaeon GW2011_AR15]MBS3103722.1 class I SAM-dependent methyltransferase [Candidatus Woesearchaeota archaeon]HIH41013.1 class I SAM-dependent methyltransferase [Candidatus Woesearchaeota archaeon]
MVKNLLYNSLAKYYDKIYHWKDYKKETKKIIELINKHKKSKGKELLDVACGTGTHISLLKKKFNCTGVDLNEDMLRVARKKVRGVVFRKADMASFSLNKKFDVITCLFSAIGHLKTDRQIERAIESFSRHLKQGGVLVIEPWITKETYSGDLPFMRTYDSDNLKIARLNVSKKKGDMFILEVHYLVAERGKGVSYFRETSRLKFSETGKMLKYMKKYGIKAKFLKNGLMKGRGLFVGVKL